MRILHLLQAIDDGDHTRQLLALLPALSERDTLEVCCLGPQSAWTDRLRQCGVPVHALGWTRWFDPGVWLNLRGREAAGSVAPADCERVRREVIDALLDWKLEGGAPVVARALPREELYAGPLAERAPDVVVELALEHGYAHSLVPTPWGDGEAPAVRTLGDDELAGGRGRGMNGTHRPDGIWLAIGGSAGERSERPASIAGVARVVLQVLGIALDEVRPTPPPRPAPYDAAEEARVTARLRALGYLE